jgi:hypothetical protein
MACIYVGDKVITIIKVCQGILSRVELVLFPR